MNDNIVEGKKLLILAGEANLITLVERARSLGVYTIVTDYYTCEESPAKKIADEFWNISWSDIDVLEKKCREEKIDGVTTGYSESPLECCIELCKRLGLPCYCTKEQLEFTRNKVLFKEICRRAGVPVVKEYNSIEEVDAFPIIVKPVDRAGSIGVSIATNMDELRQAYDYAMKKSYCKHVIIEQYIHGTKIDVYYEIIDGQITLLSTDSVINAKNNGYKRVVQSAWYLPSHAHNLIVEKVDLSLRKMINNLGITDGYLFISGFEYNGELMFFESGFRLGGEHLYNYHELLGYINSLDVFIYHALTGSTSVLKQSVNNTVNNNIKCININLYANAGIVKQIEGLDLIRKMTDCYFTLVTGFEGQVCEDNVAILSKLGMFYFCNENAYELKNDVKKAYSLLKILDTKGNDMLYDKIDSSRIDKLWD
ncbi:MAG: ATP-grasp domain-containing protein [Ruminococcaceae bacterium]|nr:ATP-grasp domain-containing protein [Oscillospiraceae bacterium]